MLLTLLALSLAAPVPTPTAPGTSIVWYDRDLSESLEQARSSDQLVMVYAWRNESEYCAKLFSETLENEAVGDVLQDWVCHSASFDSELGAKTARALNVQTLPTLFFLRSDGEVEDAIAGYIAPERFVQELERISRGEGTLSDLRKKAESSMGTSNEDLEKRYALAGKLLDLGQKEEHDAIVSSIRDADPKVLTKTGAECHLWEAQDLATAEASDVQDSSTWNMDPFYSLCKRTKGKEARYTVWSRLGSIEAGREQTEAAADAFKKAWSFCPADQRVAFGAGITNWLSETEGELSKKHERFMLATAEEVVRIFEAIEPGSDAAHELIGEERYEDHQAWYLHCLAQAYHRAGKQKSAVATGQRVVALAPDREDYREHLGKYRTES